MPSFRFLHTSDLHLEQPPAGLAELPDHLRELLIEAPYRACANIFEAAQRHDVEFILLVGDIVAPRLAGPRGTLFLRDQFARLAEQKIAVYWAGGNVDRICQWPSAIEWPANVFVCPSDRPGCFTVTKSGRVVCEILGQSQSNEGAVSTAAYEPALSDSKGPFVVGMAYGDFDPSELGSRQIGYWALGGQHELTLPEETRPVVHYPGTPQGRTCGETGPRGCTLVQVTEEGDIRTMPLVTDVVRYYQERLTLEPSAISASSELERLLRESLQSLADSNPSVPLLIDVAIDFGEALPPLATVHVPLPAIVATLRGEYGYRSPPVWLNHVRLPAPLLPESWVKQENLLGDFLRAARQLQSTSDSVDLDRYLPTDEWLEPVAAVVRLSHREQLQAAVRNAAGLGASLLQPAEAH